jgi:hypothetical protein
MRIRLAALGLLAGTHLAAAQSRINDLSAFYALIYTPQGALPSPVMVQVPRDSASRFSADVRYGRYKYRDEDVSFNNVGLGAQMRVFHSVRVGGVVSRRTCSVTCDALSMAGVEASSTLLHRRATEPGAGDSELGLVVNAGTGKPSKAAFSVMSFGMSLPMTVTLPQSNEGLLALSVMPGIAYGQLKDDGGVIFATRDSLNAVVPGPKGTFGTTRFIIGANIAYLFPFGLGIHGTVHRIAIEESTTQSGVVVTWRF